MGKISMDILNEIKNRSHRDRFLISAKKPKEIYLQSNNKMENVIQ